MKLKAYCKLLPAVALSLASFGALATDAPTDTSSSAGTMLMDQRIIGTTPGISPEFAAYQQSLPRPVELPVPQTTEEWLEMQAILDAPGIKMGKEVLKKMDIKWEKKQFAGVDVFFLEPKEVAPEYKDKWLIHLHGGAFVLGGNEVATREAAWLANGIGAKVISVDYRRPPLHPFPAALEDALAVYKELIKTQAPEETAIFGGSAGGNLTLATAHALRQQDLPVPGALFAGTPAVNLAEAYETWYTLKGLDQLGQRDGFITEAFNIYANGEDLKNPLISPIFGSFDASFPPTILISGTRDMLLSDTVQVHRKLRASGVDADLHVYDGQAHHQFIASIVWPFPEAEDALSEISNFFDKHINNN